jgi:hypothetical protein
MALQLFPEVVECIVGNFHKLNGKTILLLDDSFNFSDVSGSVVKSFPESLDVTKAKCVLGHFTIPSVEISGCSVEAVGPVEIRMQRTGKISGFIVFDGSTSKSLVSDGSSIVEKIFFCSDSIAKIGNPGVVILQDVEAVAGKNNVFYSFNLTLMGI